MAEFSCRSKIVASGIILPGTSCGASTEIVPVSSLSCAQSITCNLCFLVVRLNPHHCSNLDSLLHSRVDVGVVCFVSNAVCSPVLPAPAQVQVAERLMLGVPISGGDD